MKGEFRHGTLLRLRGYYLLAVKNWEQEQPKVAVQMAFYMRNVGGGHFGDVYKTRYEGQWAAVKKVPQDRITVKHIEREWRICQQVNHNNVVKILGMPWLAESKWHIPLEFINGETLEMTIFEQRKSKIQLTSSNMATIIAGMCEGLHYLHKKCIVHQDLKPDNIMVEHGPLRAVIIDLGLAKLYCGGGFSSATDNGDKNYTAPEIFSGHSRDIRSDVWAMGYACPYQHPTTTMGHSVHNVDISKPLTHATPYTLPAICPVQLKPRFISEEDLSPVCQWPLKTTPQVKNWDVAVLGWHGHTWSAVVRPVGRTSKISEVMLETAYGGEMCLQVVQSQLRWTGACVGHRRRPKQQHPYDWTEGSLVISHSANIC
ncbi:hypothetical protein SKAU_G00417600 [Synaphobranchus kaupii]|uniref:Protein kinase domain-containing protein n=1 Tax=Synaphobranchus kaupii TaxID=118154 RepID=A0A9Q1IAU5_SYNKA|nr:hypothetical protein SKAU_G00417600 [Synaphobranchus kaupii]